MMRRLSMAGIIVLAVVMATPSGVGAQEASRTAPPYDPQMLRLSEILGALHYLRRLCDSDEGGVWRQQMEALLDSERPDDVRRARMVDRFNRGYESFRAVYRGCTPSAALAVERYVDEGAQITADIVARYGESDG